ncbi:hypothetical protein AB0M23_16985 [Streptomyces sp. NPDC052077]
MGLMPDPAESAEVRAAAVVATGGPGVEAALGMLRATDFRRF